MTASSWALRFVLLLIPNCKMVPVHSHCCFAFQVAAKIIRRRSTEEGEMYHDSQHINIQPETSNEPCVLLIWPLTIIHEIDEDSPFYEYVAFFCFRFGSASFQQAIDPDVFIYRMSASEIANDKFELVVGMEGTIESTSMTFQARTSYLPNEILWGHRFEPMMVYRRENNKYQVLKITLSIMQLYDVL